MHTEIASASAAILTFRIPSRAPHRFSMRERLQLAEWEPQARRCGLARVVLHETVAECAPEHGDFVLVYRDGTPWAEFGVGIEQGRYMAWRPATGVTLGRYDHLNDALAAVIAAWAGGSLPLQA